MDAKLTFLKARSSHAVAVMMGVGALWGCERLCYAALRLLGMMFPSSVAGMLLAFGCLLLLRSTLPDVAERVAHVLAPGRLFLTRWMALFFVPPLVQLPLNAVPEITDLLGCVVIVVGGFGANLIVTAWVASRGTATTLPPKPKAINAVAWSRRSVLGLWSGVAFVGWLGFCCCSAPEALLAFGVAIAVLGFVWAEIGRAWLMTRGFEGAALVLHPVLVSACVAGVCWRLAGQPLSTYLYHGSTLNFDAAGNCLMALLAPAVVSLGLVLDLERELLRANVRALLQGTTCGALFSLLSSAVLSRVFDLSEVYARALLPKAVTTPVALVIAQIFGGNAGLTACFVVLSGVLGALFAVPILQRLGFVAPFVQGVATGVSSHGIGTAALVRDNPTAAAFSAISFALTAALSVSFASVGVVRSVIEWLLAY